MDTKATTDTYLVIHRPTGIWDGAYTKDMAIAAHERWNQIYEGGSMLVEIIDLGGTEADNEPRKGFFLPEALYQGNEEVFETLETYRRSEE